MLVGEAAGHKGCKYSGIPFTSEKTVISNPFFSFLHKDLIYQDLLSRSKVNTENSATIVWDVIEQLPHVPFLWNAFPFHPHKKNNLSSNRTPTKQELELGGEYLNFIIDFLKPIKIIAVGQKSFSALKKLSIVSTPVRHPSFGGKKNFELGVLNAIGSA